MPTQVKLLRVLQDRNVRPVGGSAEVEVDVRVVAGNNRDVESAVEAGTFREDLFYRLNVIRIEVPPLRERPEDIPVLAQYFLQKHSAVQERRLAFAPDAMRWLAQQYPATFLTHGIDLDTMSPADVGELAWRSGWRSGWRSAWRSA